MLHFEHHLQVTTSEQSVIELLKQACSNEHLTIAQIKTAITKGALWLTHKQRTTRLRKVKKVLTTGDQLHFYYDEKVLNQRPLPAQLIADQQDYSIWYKPYGMLSQGSKWSDHCTIARWAETHLLPQRPAFIVHRLDRAASGLIILAHSKKAARAFSHLFEQHSLSKRYHIIVHGHFTTNENNDALAVSTPVDGKNARSWFSPLSYDAEHDLSLVAVDIETGRKHQIRQHAASIGFPVVGDRLHGLSEQQPEQINLQLSAVQLAFHCPFTDQMREFSLPESLRPQLNNLMAK